MFKLTSLKTQMILYLTCFAIFLAWQEHSWLFLWMILVAISATIVTELITLKIIKKPLRVSESAIITGLIIGFVLSSDEPWIRFVAAALIAIGSKYLFRWANKHIFNPAGFGVLAVILLFGAYTQWHGTYLWYIVIPVGLYFAYRFKKLEVLIGYAIVFLGLFGGQALVNKVSVLSAIGYLSYFYIFVMVIEPKTSPYSSWGKYIFGGLVAVIVFILTSFGVGFDAEITGLLAVNILVFGLNKIAVKKGVV